MIRDCVYDSKTSCFAVVEGLSITVKCHTFHTKTSCFGVKSMVLYGERKAFYDTKTTCFAVVEAVSYHSNLTYLSLKGRLFIARDPIVIAISSVAIGITSSVLVIACVVIYREFERFQYLRYFVSRGIS